MCMRVCVYLCMHARAYVYVCVWTSGGGGGGGEGVLLGMPLQIPAQINVH